MPSIDLTKVKEVIETSNLRAVKEHLENGWVLIETASGKDESGYPLIKYSLAKA